MSPTSSRCSTTSKLAALPARDAIAGLPPQIVAALDALEACYPSYSASAAKARADVERAISEALPPMAGPRPAAVLRLVSGARRRQA
jgi:hypothetical protein